MDDEKAALERLGDVQFVMADERGRRYVRGLLREFGLYRSVMAVRSGAMNSERVFYNAGQQDAAHYIQKEAADADPVNFMKMNGEAHARQLLRQAEARQRGRKIEEETGE